MITPAVTRFTIITSRKNNFKPAIPALMFHLGASERKQCQCRKGKEIKTMSRLFIIGNGYDMARRGDTGYTDFRKWLIRTYAEDYMYANIDETDFTIYNRISSIPSHIYEGLMKFNNEAEKADYYQFCNESDAVRKQFVATLFLEEMQHLEWNRLEANLSYLPIRFFAEEWEKQNKEKNTSLPSSLGTTVSREVELVTSMPSELQILFAEWVASLPETSEKVKEHGFEKRVIKEIKSDDTFIIFNYTTTIEDLFHYQKQPNTEDVFYHIHGVKNDKRVVIGHNDKSKTRFDTSLCNTDDYIQECYVALRKPSEIIISQNKALWNRVKENSGKGDFEIWEYGWSCGQVDKDYLEKIISIVKDKNVTLYLNNYGNGADQKAEAWKACGFPEENIKHYTEEKENIIFT